LAPFRFRNLGKNNVKGNHFALYFRTLAEFDWGRGKFDAASLRFLQEEFQKVLLLFMKTS
jgi:hypothetical protein